MIRPGEPWGEPVTEAPDLEVSGGDAALAREVDAHPGALVRFRPDAGSDLARAVGLVADGEPTGIAAPIDALRAEPGGTAVNGVILGTPPGRIRFTTRSAHVRIQVNGRSLVDEPATTVVIANGQFLDGLDVVPRGHPGDGRLEVQVYSLRRGERRAMRARLPQGVHVPHPRIAATTGRLVEVHIEGGQLPMTIDGVPSGSVSEVTVTVIPGALRLAL